MNLVERLKSWCSADAARWVFIAIVVCAAGPKLCVIGESFFHWLGSVIPGVK